MTLQFCGAPRGLIPIASAPFDSKERLDEDSFRTELEKLYAAKVDGIMAPGFATEFYKLSDAEHQRISSMVIDFCAALDSVKSVVSVTAHSTAAARDYTQWAVERGADVVNILLPHFLSPSVPAVTDHLRAVLLAAGETPVMVQYAPQLTASSVSLDGLLDLRHEHPNLSAVKIETMPPGPDVEFILTHHKSLNVLVGYAGMHMIDAMERGAVGVQPSASFVEIYRKILDYWDDGDFELARDLHRKLLPYIAYWMQGVELIVAVDKRIAHMRGWFAADYARKPARQLDRHELATVDLFLEEFREVLSL